MTGARRRLAAALAGLAACAPPAARGGGSRDASLDAVRAARAAFNAAIAGRDTAAIARLLLDDYVIVTGRSAQARGRDAAMASWAEAMRDIAMRYVRTPRTVRVNAAWGLAEELGDWTGRLAAPDGAVRASGVYAAKWQRATTGAWRLQAEIFTTLSCAGGPLGCPPPAPVP